MFEKVFISYAKEDYDLAEILYWDLKRSGYIPWLDKKELLVGQNWDFVLKTELREADFIVLILSNSSVQKRGYVQREFRLALEYYEEKLDDDIFLIPIKVDNCKVPLKLTKFQWLEYLGDFNQVIEAIDTQRRRYLEIEQSKLDHETTFQYEDQFQQIEYGDKIKLNIKTKYPKFLDKDHLSLYELNQFIQGRISQSLLWVRRHFFEIDGSFTEHRSFGSHWNLNVSYNLNLVSKSIVSISENENGYLGGAHRFASVNGLNFNLFPLIRIEIMDVFEEEDHENILEFISDFCLKKLEQRVASYFKQEEGSTMLWKDGFYPKWENFSNFLLSNSGIEFVFNEYTVGPYVLGLNYVMIPFGLIIERLSKPKKLSRIINELHANIN